MSIRPKPGSLQVQVEVPSFFLCPISLELMRDPVTLSSGHTFDRANIQRWLDDGNRTCPLTRQPLHDLDLEEDPIPNHALRRMIQAWCLQHASCGVDRILTPRQPPSLHDIPSLLDLVDATPAAASTTSSTPHVNALDALQKLTRLALDRSRSRKIMLLSGALPLISKLLSRSFTGMAPAFSSVAAVPTALSLTLADEALRLLDLLIDPAFYAGIDLQQLQCHEELILSLANVLLRTATSDSRWRAASILTRLQPSNHLRRKMGEMHGFMAHLVGMIRDDEPILSKAALGVLVDLCEASNRNRVSATETGAVVTLAKLLERQCALRHGSDDKASTETSILRALELMCQCAEGRAAVAADVHITTAVVKQMGAVSERAAHHAVRILLLVVTLAAEADAVKACALQNGALVKAIAVAQSATNSETSQAAQRLVVALSEAIPREQLAHTIMIL